MIAPLVSVIMPVYNRAWCVAEAIDSVLGIDLPGLELVIVDDGSDDATPQILDRYAELHPERMQVHTHPDRVNRGIAASRNLGVAQSRGKYVAFLDSDDVYLPDRFRHAIDWLDRHGDFLACVEPYQIEEASQDNPASEVRHLTTVSPIDFGWLRAMLFANTYWNMPVITLRREAPAQFGGFDESLRFAEETSLWLKLAAVGAVGVAQNLHPVACVRLHNEHSWDPSDRKADLGTFLHVLLDVLAWSRGRADVEEGVRALLRRKLETFLVEILSDPTLPLAFRMQSWLDSVAIQPRLMLVRHVIENLAYAPFRSRTKDTRT